MTDKVNTKEQLLEKLKDSPRPVIVELWAPWCGPCRVMAPSLEKASHEYEGKVDLLRINSDESPALTQALGVMGIPTLIGFYQGKEIFRKTGAQSLPGLQALFAAALSGEPARSSLSTWERVLRLGMGAVIIALALINGSTWWLIAAGAGVMFTAVYDRCPIYNAIAPRIKTLLKMDR
ncbi:MAG: DUF2892 domain-containing protein [Anaerolineaceae bacterium]|nr:DUF2892 domain-containing protein [Anaerolineaceae bacterium]